MPKTDGFLGRWSRRKLEAREAPEPVVEAAAVVDLPAVETLGGASDYTAFLQQGVSAVVQQQALRRAWESDASIAAFRGMADYDWDFNAPSYGKLWAADDVVKLVQEVLASPPAEEPVDASAALVAETFEEVPIAVAAAPAVEEATIAGAIAPAVKEASGGEAAMPPRRHGSALPC